MEWLPSYREAFYEMLSPRLEERGIDLLVTHGAPPASRRQRNDSVEPPWATFVPNGEATIAGLELTWQPVWRLARQAQLVVVQQETGLLFNYVALAHRRLGGPTVAMWGHGENPNPESSSRLAEGVKRKATPLADWFFAYTPRSADVARSLGISDDRITVVNNARMSDADKFDAADAAKPVVDLVATVRNRSSHVGWMVSALDKWKRLDQLIETLDGVRSLVPDFEFFVLGQGDDDSIVFDAAETRPWLHALGSRFGADKAAIGSLADITLQPGLVGLHVVDAFAFGTPMVTVEDPIHSHEFDYLVDGENAVVLPANSDANALAKATAELLQDRDRLQRLKQGCDASSEKYTIDSMVDRFADGIEAALALDG